LTNFKLKKGLFCSAKEKKEKKKTMCSIATTFWGRGFRKIATFYWCPEFWQRVHPTWGYVFMCEICTPSPGYIAQHERFLFICCISALLFDPLYSIQLFHKFYVGRIGWMIGRNTQLSLLCYVQLPFLVWVSLQYGLGL